MEKNTHDIIPEIDMYLANVREVLSTKARKDVNEYLDKYIQVAPGTAYNATLMIVY